MAENKTIQFRADYEDVLMSVNPVLQEREICFNMSQAGYKVGNGSTPFNDLPWRGIGGQIPRVIDGRWQYYNEDIGEWVDTGMIASSKEFFQGENKVKSISNLPTDKHRIIVDDSEHGLKSGTLSFSSKRRDESYFVMIRNRTKSDVVMFLDSTLSYHKGYITLKYEQECLVIVPEFGDVVVYFTRQLNDWCDEININRCIALNVNEDVPAANIKTTTKAFESTDNRILYDGLTLPNGDIVFDNAMGGYTIYNERIGKYLDVSVAPYMTFRSQLCVAQDTNYVYQVAMNAAVWNITTWKWKAKVTAATVLISRINSGNVMPPLTPLYKKNNTMKDANAMLFLETQLNGIALSKNLIGVTANHVQGVIRVNDFSAALPYAISQCILLHDGRVLLVPSVETDNFLIAEFDIEFNGPHTFMKPLTNLGFTPASIGMAFLDKSCVLPNGDLVCCNRITNKLIIYNISGGSRIVDLPPHPAVRNANAHLAIYASFDTPDGGTFLHLGQYNQVSRGYEEIIYIKTYPDRIDCGHTGIWSQPSDSIAVAMNLDGDIIYQDSFVYPAVNKLIRKRYKHKPGKNITALGYRVGNNSVANTISI